MTIPVLPDLTQGGRVVVVATLFVSILSVLIWYVLSIHGTPLFVVSALGILGLAYVVGISTERLGAHAGPHAGGILNATFGSIAELIIAFFARTAGQLEVVKTSITGSIIGNLLLVLGASPYFGGLRNGTQRFSGKVAGLDATLLTLAVIGPAWSVRMALGVLGVAAVFLAVLSEALVGSGRTGWKERS